VDEKLSTVDCSSLLFLLERLLADVPGPLRSKTSKHGLAFDVLMGVASSNHTFPPTVLWETSVIAQLLSTFSRVELWESNKRDEKPQNMGRERRPQGCVPVVAIVLVVAVVVLAIAQETSAFAVPFGGGGGRRQVKAAGGILAALTGGAEDGGGLRRPDGVEIDPIKEMPLEMTAPSPPTTSVLVLSWFYANPRELKVSQS
jgi:hypothetical protein